MEKYIVAIMAANLLSRQQKPDFQGAVEDAYLLLEIAKKLEDWKPDGAELTGLRPFNPHGRESAVRK